MNQDWIRITENITGVMDKTLEFDEIAVRNNYVSITPIHYDLTDYLFYEELKKLNLKA